MNTVMEQLNLTSPAMDFSPDSTDLAHFTDAAFFDFDQFQSEPQLKLELQSQYQQQMDDLLVLPDSLQQIFNTPVITGEQSTQPPAKKQKKAQSPPQTSPQPSNTDPETDKKNRNTAASARFRNKKKQRELEMERQVRLLSERVNSYTERINQLETENACLKSLLLEKNVQKSNNMLKSIKEKSLARPL